MRTVDSRNVKNREHRVAKSQDLRRKDNGNYIASIYPPEFALVRPRKINEEIEKELNEFMVENEVKFAKSTMNTNFTFPRKFTININDQFIPDSLIRGTTPSSVTASNSRHYKTNDNRFISNVLQFDSISNRTNQHKESKIGKLF